MCIDDGSYQNNASANANASSEPSKSEDVMVKMMREDLGVEISAQAWRMFLRHRWERFTPLAHRIHEGKR